MTDDAFHLADMSGPPRRRLRWPWLAASLAVLLVGGLVAIYLVAANNRPSGWAGSAVPSPTRTFAQPSPIPYSPTPSRTSTRPKVSPRETCLKAAQPIQDSAPLFTEFAYATNVATLDRGKYERVGARLREAYDVAAPVLAPNIGVVTEAMEKIVDFLRYGGSISLDNQTIGLAGIRVITECVKLGVVPTAG